MLRTNEKSRNIALDIRDTAPEAKLIPQAYFQTRNEISVLSEKSFLNTSYRDGIREENMKKFKGRNPSDKPITIDLTLEDE